jgi:hypothetical protein
MKVLNHCFWEEHTRIRDLCYKTGFLPAEFNNTPPFPVPENIQHTGNFSRVKDFLRYDNAGNIYG